jgi:hypothetical protein
MVRDRPKRSFAVAEFLLSFSFLACFLIYFLLCVVIYFIPTFFRSCVSSLLFYSFHVFNYFYVFSVLIYSPRLFISSVPYLYISVHFYTLFCMYIRRGSGLACCTAGSYKYKLSPCNNAASELFTELQKLLYMAS